VGRHARRGVHVAAHICWMVRQREACRIAAVGEIRHHGEGMCYCLERNAQDTAWVIDPVAGFAQRSVTWVGSIAREFLTNEAESATALRSCRTNSTVSTVSPCLATIRRSIRPATTGLLDYWTTWKYVKCDGSCSIHIHTDSEVHIFTHRCTRRFVLAYCTLSLPIPSLQASILNHCLRGSLEARPSSSATSGATRNPPAHPPSL